jgi:hypothetical protein
MKAFSLDKTGKIGIKRQEETCVLFLILLCAAKSVGVDENICCDFPPVISDTAWYFRPPILHSQQCSEKEAVRPCDLGISHFIAKLAAQLFLSQIINSARIPQ